MAPGPTVSSTSLLVESGLGLLPSVFHCKEYFGPTVSSWLVESGLVVLPSVVSPDFLVSLETH